MSKDRIEEEDKEEVEFDLDRKVGCLTIFEWVVLIGSYVAVILLLNELMP